MKNKITGAYYTPNRLSKVIINHLLKSSFISYKSILEPSVGDGSIIHSLIDQGKDKLENSSITIVDINNAELEKAKTLLQNSSFKDSYISYCDDFLNFHEKCTNNYSLIIGNPPYINRKLLDKETIRKCGEIHASINLTGHTIHNIWTSFVISSLKLLDESGVLCFVLPIDLLQVKYAEEVRDYLIDQFERIEIITTDTSVFSEIEQETVVFLGYKKAEEKGTFYYKIIDYENMKVKKISSNGLMISQSKWTHYNLSTSEIELLNRLSENLPIVSDFIISKPGIVTGANDFFIYDYDTMVENDLEKYSQPILLRSIHTEIKLDYTKSEYKKLCSNGKPAYILNLNGIKELSSGAKAYILNGELMDIDKGYKCSNRQPWYSIPGMEKTPEAFMFRRFYKVPKLYMNKACVHLTDTAYKLETKGDYNMKSFIFSFYNFITLIFAELMGRKYGGGVLELTPSEFQNLPIPYITISEMLFKQYEISFTKRNILTNLKDSFDLSNHFLNTISSNEIEQLTLIYTKLQNTRLAKN